jgi:dTDP-4-dehydrorhamnose 3,5-epimerase-like enzyme
MAKLYTIKSTENQVVELEQLTGLAFRRSYLIYRVPAGSLRGKHRHRKNHSILFCITGSVTVFVQSAGYDELFQLNSPDQALHLIPSDWRMLYDFSPDCIVLALANEPYSKLDYIPKPYRPVFLPDDKYSLSEA